MARFLTAVLAASFTLAPVARALPCESCFAVFVMPDTQNYVQDVYQPAGAAHLDLVTRYICEHRLSWTEPSTGKEMPILMVAQLGDIVQEGANDIEGQRADAAFDNLDACDPVVPYIAIVGNHDYDSAGRYHKEATVFNQYFGTARWAPYQCADPTRCDWDAGEWFIGGGDEIPMDSRNNLDGFAGPDSDQPGRHRAALIRAPSGQRFLFLGLEVAFDFPPPGDPAERDDSAWPKQVLSDYPGVHTVLLHHSLFDPDGQFGGDNFFSDSLVTMEGVWDELVEPFPQILMTLNGHYQGGVRENDWTLPTPSGLDVFALFRNYQAGAHSYSDGGYLAQKDGWNVILVFDPEAGEIRARSYRIEDVDDDGTHDGPPAPTASLDMDFLGRTERVFAYDFPDARPASLDNCPGVPNPDQADANGDGRGDACTGVVPALDFPGILWTAALLVLFGAALLRARARTDEQADS